MEKRPSKQKKTTVSREFSSGGAVFKKSSTDTFLWLITRSTPSTDYPTTYWRLQKGWLDDINNGDAPGPMASGKVRANEKDLQETALREVKEEGGVNAKIIKKIATEKYFYVANEGQKVLKFVTFYLMEWLKDTKEGHDFETSEVRWLAYPQARKLLTYSGEKKILDEADKLLKSIKFDIISKQQGGVA